MLQLTQQWDSSGTKQVIAFLDRLTRSSHVAKSARRAGGLIARSRIAANVLSLPEAQSGIIRQLSALVDTWRLAVQESRAVKGSVAMTHIPILPFAVSLTFPYLHQYVAFALVPFAALCLLLLPAVSPKFRYSLPSIALPFVVLILSWMISAAASVTLAQSLGELAISLCGPALFLLAVNVIDTRERLEIMLFCLAVSVSVTALAAVYQFYSSDSIPDAYRGWVDAAVAARGLTRRAYATFWANPNLIATLFSASVPFFWFVSGVMRNFRMRCFLLAASLLSAWALYLTFSRGGWLGLAVAFAVTAAAWGGWMIRVLIPAAAGMLLFLPDQAVHRIVSIFGTADSSNAYRLAVWDATAKAVGKYWITGAGYGRTAFARAYGEDVTWASGVGHAHNLYLQTALEGGVLGIVVYLAFAVWLASYAFKLCQSQGKPGRLLGIGLIGAGTAVAAHSVADYTLWYFKLGIFVWTLAAVAVAGYTLDRHRRLEI